MTNKDASFTLGERLKGLRQKRGLSHVALKKQLEDKYDISISRDSLMAYEITDEAHSKAEKLPNFGMRVEYLYCLADFYGVSLDYLLGKTNTRSPDAELREICEYTGLSEEAITSLHLEYSTNEAQKIILWLIEKIVLEGRQFQESAWKAAVSELACIQNVDAKKFSPGVVATAMLTSALSGENHGLIKISPEDARLFYENEAIKDISSITNGVLKEFIKNFVADK